MCPQYVEEFKPTQTYRPVTREARYINRIVSGQHLSLDHALFLPSSLEAIRSIVHNESHRVYLEADLRLLTGDLPAKIPANVDRLLQLYRRMPFSMLDQISEGELHRLILEMDSGFSPKKASEALWGMEIIVSDHDLPFDRLTWGLDWLQKHHYLPERDPDELLIEETGSNCVLIRGIEILAERILVNQNGSHHTGRIQQLSRWPGVEHTVLESDSFGPLRCGLLTNKGTICYG